MTLARLDYERVRSLVVARLRGEVDMSNANNLREALNEATPNDALGLILDLSEVEYLDSAGIHLIYRLREELRRRGQGFRIVVPPDSVVNDTLRLAGIHREDETVTTAAEACVALEQRSDVSAH